MFCQTEWKEDGFQTAIPAEHFHTVRGELTTPASVPFEKKPKISGAAVGTEQKNKWGTLERFRAQTYCRNANK